MSTFYSGRELNPFRFTHPADWHADEGYIYVLQASTGVVKVGYTAYPHSRIQVHIADAQGFGAEVAALWVSEPHANGRDTERELLTYCRQQGGNEIAGEYFTGLNFGEVVEAAECLDKRRWSPADGSSLRFAPGAVKGLRRAHGWTVRNFADQAQISAGYLSKLERGIQDVAPNTMWRIADAFGVSLAALTVDKDAYAEAMQAAFREPLAARTRPRRRTALTT